MNSFLLLTLFLLNFTGCLTLERSVNFYKSGKMMADRMKVTLDELLGSYNRQIRPGFGGSPCKITLNLSIRSIGPVDERTQAYYVDAYFRQTWRDERLAFNATGGVNNLPLNWQFLNKIWKPDTFFLNGKRSKLHKITVPNRFIRISPAGKVSFSQRLTIHARCLMHLQKFPFDSQICPLQIGSYGYTSDDVIYAWKKNPLSIEEKLGMTQFDLVKWVSGIDVSTTNRKIASGFRNDSVAYLHFYFERQTGYFLLQIYTPLIIIVMCSWVAFWIVKTDAPARVALGVSSSLSVTKIGFAGKGKPNVEYATALDIFIIICFMTVFLGLIEYALINFISVFINRYKARENDSKRLSPIPPTTTVTITHDEDDVNKKESTTNIVGISRVTVGTMTEEPRRVSKEEILDFFSKFGVKMTKLAEFGLAKLVSFFTVRPLTRMYIYTNTDEALENIDDVARKAFPAGFVCIMIFYVSLYFYILDDKHIE